MAAICIWLWRWRRQNRDPVNQVMAGILLSIMVAMLVSSLTQESLSPSFAQVAWLVHFYLVLGLWMSWYRYETLIAWQRATARKPVVPAHAASSAKAIPPGLLGPATRWSTESGGGPCY